MEKIFRYSSIFSLIIYLTTCSSKDWTVNLGTGSWEVAKLTCEAYEMKLPTIGELVKYYNSGIPYNLEKTIYWSSTPHESIDDEIRYYTIHMNNGYVTEMHKSLEWNILCKKK